MLSNRSRLDSGELFLVNYYEEELDQIGIDKRQRELFFEKVWEIIDENQKSDMAYSDEDFIYDDADILEDFEYEDDDDAI